MQGLATKTGYLITNFSIKKKVADFSTTFGAEDRTRTDTLLRARDFKSLVSANSTTSAFCFLGITLLVFGGTTQNRTED